MAVQAVASGPRKLSTDIRRAWATSGVFVVTDTWLKMSMKRKERWPEGKYIVKKPEMKEPIVPPKKPRVPLFDESQSTEPAQEPHPLLQEDSNNPFIIEDIDPPPDVEETTRRLRPLSISPIAEEKRKPPTSKSQPPSLSATPSKSKSKFMTLKSPAKKSPSQPPAAPPLFDQDGSHNNGSLLQNNLTEILRRVKKENKPPLRRPPRKLQGRANSASEDSGLLGGNSLSRDNSIQSNAEGGQDSIDTTASTTSKYKYGLTSLSRADSIANNDSNSNSNTLDFGESMVYDSNPESGPRNLQLDPDSQQPLSQAVHYVDAEAEVERKKLFEKLKMVDDGGVLKGRLVVKSTVAAQEMGGPVPRVGRARKG
ncbi:hypothetical protein TWF481_001063 [Arthrobotrys musiformis]|uniref:BRCT domain-containing protein n=1 Tax=Arthrobotrys musiformis TaxID=47236 RepID=A0AAV9WRH5_9PEZI